MEGAPTPNIDECFKNEDDIRGFGDNLCKDTLKNRILYDEYAKKYDKI